MTALEKTVLTANCFKCCKNGHTTTDCPQGAECPVCDTKGHKMDSSKCKGLIISIKSAKNSITTSSSIGHQLRKKLTKLRILQTNLIRNRAALDLLNKTAEEENADIAIVSAPNKYKQPWITDNRNDVECLVHRLKLATKSLEMFLCGC